MCVVLVPVSANAGFNMIPSSDLRAWDKKHASKKGPQKIALFRPLLRVVLFKGGGSQKKHACFLKDETFDR